MYAAYARICDTAEIDDAGQVHVLLIRDGHPACDISEDLTVCAVSIIKSWKVDHMHANVVIPYETEDFDSLRAYFFMSVRQKRSAKGILQISRPCTIVLDCLVHCEMKEVFPEPVTPMTAMKTFLILYTI